MDNQQQAHTEEILEEEQEGQGQMSNQELIGRLNALHAVKPHFTVPKIKLAFNRNMTRLERALEPFQEAEADLKEDFEVPEQAPIFDENNERIEGIEDEFYERRTEYLNADGEPYDEYTVPESLLDNEPGQMRDGRIGLPDGAITAVLWMFDE